MNSLTQILQETAESPIPYHFGCQVQSCLTKLTKSQKPYYELKLVDTLESVALKIWDNHPQFDQASSLKAGQFLSIEGSFTKNQYGLDSPNWQWQTLSESEKETLLSGDPALKHKQDADWEAIRTMLSEIKDPRLHSVCQKFISDFNSRLKRAAAARKNHHARRGGLIEHIAQMMKSACAICTVYPNLNQDLMVTAVLFHDSGKLWENNYPEEDFHQIYSLHAEALGHITLGIELLNKIWRDCAEDSANSHWRELNPPTEHVRIHLMHMIASHHGTLEFGSPVTPKTPEAFALHFIDNLDAKMEMCDQAYEKSNKLSPQIFEKQFPLPGNLLTPLPHHS